MLFHRACALWKFGTVSIIFFLFYFLGMPFIPQATHQYNFSHKNCTSVIFLSTGSKLSVRVDFYSLRKKKGTHLRYCQNTHIKFKLLKFYKTWYIGVKFSFLSLVQCIFHNPSKFQRCSFHRRAVIADNLFVDDPFFLVDISLVRNLPQR